MSRLFTVFFSWRRLAGNRRLFFACLLLFSLSALLSFWFSFPAEVLQRRLIQEVSRQTNIRMQGENPAVLLPIGLRMDLSVYPDLPELVDLHVSELEITPLWSSLFSGEPKVRVQGGIAGGRFDVKADRNGNINLETDRLAVEQLLREDLDYRVNGRLTGFVNAQRLSTDMEGEGEFSLDLAGTEILGLEKIGLAGVMPMGLIQVKGKFSRNRLSLEEIVATQGALELSGGGTLLVGDRPESTRLNLSLRIHTTPSTPEGLRDLLNVTGIRPTADGSYLLRIGGTLAKPVVR